MFYSKLVPRSKEGLGGAGEGLPCLPQGQEGTGAEHPEIPCQESWLSCPRVTQSSPSFAFRASSLPECLRTALPLHLLSCIAFSDKTPPKPHQNPTNPTKTPQTPQKPHKPHQNPTNPTKTPKNPPTPPKPPHHQPPPSLCPAMPSALSEAQLHF